MADTFFVADVHLGFDSAGRFKLFSDFVEHVRACSGDLYILGDFFDFWANNRAVYQRMRPVLERLGGLAAQGATVGFVFGNRDFLIGPDTLGPFGITFLGEQADISLAGKRVHLTHGYSLCLDDRRFQVYKKIMWPVFGFFDRVLPGALVNYLVRTFFIRDKVPDTRPAHPQDPRCHFTRAAIESHFERGIDAVICGHTHAEESFTAGAKQFYSLGCWDDARGAYLLHSGGVFTRKVFGTG